MRIALQYSSSLIQVLEWVWFTLIEADINNHSASFPSQGYHCTDMARSLVTTAGLALAASSGSAFLAHTPPASSRPATTTPSSTAGRAPTHQPRHRIESVGPLQGGKGYLDAKIFQPYLNFLEGICRCPLPSLLGSAVSVSVMFLPQPTDLRTHASYLWCTRPGCLDPSLNDTLCGYFIKVLQVVHLK